MDVYFAGAGPLAKHLKEVVTGIIASKGAEEGNKIAASVGEAFRELQGTCHDATRGKAFLRWLRASTPDPTRAAGPQNEPDAAKFRAQWALHGATLGLVLPEAACPPGTQDGSEENPLAYFG